MIDYELLVALERVRPNGAKWAICQSKWERVGSPEFIEWRVPCWLLLEEMLAAGVQTRSYTSKGYLAEAYNIGGGTARRAERAAEHLTALVERLNEVRA